jgi:hypothetical protein
MRAGLTFSLSSLMLVVVCAALASCLAAAAPAWGIAFASLAALAVARTAMLLRREFPERHAPSVRIRVATFFESMVLLAYVTIVCAVVTLMAALSSCLLVAMACAVFTSDEMAQFDAGAMTGVIVGPLVGLLAWALYLRAYWSRRQF